MERGNWGRGKDKTDLFEEQQLEGTFPHPAPHPHFIHSEWKQVYFADYCTNISTRKRKSCALMIV